MTTYEEWRVTGDPGEGFPPYSFTWSTRGYGEPEVEARSFARTIRVYDNWRDGPHVHKRTVTVTDWEQIE